LGENTYFNSHRASYLWFITHYKTKKNKYNIIFIYKNKNKNLGNDFFSKIRVYYAFTPQEVQK
jgi:hypothetical protein